MSLVVVGTDTEIGKTVISALLMIRYRHCHPAYWKPLATGDEEPRDVTQVRTWAGSAATVHDETYHFPTPASPHLAARLAGARIDLAELERDWQRRRAAGQPLVVEGIGGVLVPLTDDGPLLADWLAGLDLPCLLVARAGLGTINHTLLTLEAMRSRGLRPIGVVMNGPRDAENRRAIERFGDTTVVAEVEPIAPLAAAGMQAAAARFDHDGHLERWFTEAAKGETP